ncbi:hypothetical protein QF035_008977 [Streptomyces umbrinus]|uniref:Uncharacterized protein n=1 Tax=Streptomyces umbrinus TaxID=67370 RepID=A0ABU0T6G7_9ACTN|nr:hypothetical protein [Streptomyces umbrinus]
MVDSGRSVEIRLGQPLRAALPQEPAAHVGVANLGCRIPCRSRVRCEVSRSWWRAGSVRLFRRLGRPSRRGRSAPVPQLRHTSRRGHVESGHGRGHASPSRVVVTGIPAPDFWSLVAPIPADSPAPDFRAPVARPEASGHRTPPARARRCPCRSAPWSASGGRTAPTAAWVVSYPASSRWWSSWSTKCCRLLDVIENAYECGTLGSFASTRSVSVPADEEVQIWGGTLPTRGMRKALPVSLGRAPGGPCSARRRCAHGRGRPGAGRSSPGAGRVGLS